MTIVRKEWSYSDNKEMLYKLASGWGEDAEALRDLVGKTIQKVVRDDDQVTIYTEGNLYELYHGRDCCEQSQIIKFELAEKEGCKIAAITFDTHDFESQDTTFTIVTFYIDEYELEHCEIVWRISSNGYYSQDVSVRKFDKINEDE